MSRVTRIVPRPDRGKVWIYVDDSFCTSVRERTFPALDLAVGMNITCDELKARESFIWKRLYQGSWQAEKSRLRRVSEIIENLPLQVQTNVVGFGADSTDMIKEHPEESGAPDLELIYIPTGELVARVEVTGTERYKGERKYWIRPDKIQYAREHRDVPTWIAVHFAKPEETLRFICPDIQRQYEVCNRQIRSAVERYIEFDDHDPEVFGVKGFESWLRFTLLTTFGIPRD